MAGTKLADDFIEFCVRHKLWSRQVAGEGLRTEALTRHIEKECAELRANPDDRMEAVDIIILGMELYFRQPFTSTPRLVQDLLLKMGKIERRNWPKVAEGQPMEHQRGTHD
jgi:hypothetical protein